MAKIKALNILQSSEMVKYLQDLPLWSLSDQSNAIQRTFRFVNFDQAFAFMTKVATEAERHNHHPEWFNVYNKVEITWTTHDVKGLSIKDIQMAIFCDQLFSHESQTLSSCE